MDVPLELDAGRAQLPDDGHRYEVVDGALVVTPSPIWGHQQCHMGLIRQLLATCPAHLTLLAAPFDVVLDDRTVVQPDLLVARRDRSWDLAAAWEDGPARPRTGWPIPTS